MDDIANVMDINSTCAYCGVGCGITSKHDINSGELISVGGDVKHPANRGRLCLKGATLGATLSAGKRLQQPMLAGQPVTWDHAMDHVATQFQRIINTYGPQSVAFYLSGQLLTEDYYVANKLMKGFIGSPNVDTNSRLCMSSSVIGHQRAFGEDIVPGCYDDLEHADLVLLVGSNMAWTHPILHQRLLKARESNPSLKIVVLDPRSTATAQLSDVHLPIAPDSDTSFFVGLLAYMASNNGLDHGYITDHCQGFDDSISVAQSSCPDIASVAKACNLPIAQITQVFDWFCQTSKVVSVFSQGVNQSTSGSDKVSAIINCHLASGKIGKPGATPFSITGQPNAMGGREVGGLANQLAAHMDYEKPQDIDRVRRFWQAPNIVNGAGLKAVDLFSAMGDGRIKAVWIMATNPVFSLPDSHQVEKALQQCELVVVSDSVANTDTTAFAHVQLPASGWGEKDGTVTNSERMISRQRSIIKQPPECRHDWQMVVDLAHRLGYENAFDYQSSADIFREHAALSGFENNQQRLFNISELAHLNDDEYRDLKPIQWPITRSQGALSGQQRLFTNGRYATANGRARLHPVTPSELSTATAPQFPLWLNTSRARDQWHSMSRTGQVAQLIQHQPVLQVDLHPFDAKAFGLRQSEWAAISSALGQVHAQANINPNQLQGHVFMPMHWGKQFASRGRIGQLIAARTDAASGQPDYKHTPVNVSPIATLWRASLISREELTFDNSILWFKRHTEAGYHYELAGTSRPSDWLKWAHEWLPPYNDLLQLKVCDQSSYRLATYLNDALQAVLVIAPTLPLVNTAMVNILMQQQKLTPQQRLQVLSTGLSNHDGKLEKLICACMRVSASDISGAIDQGNQDITSLKKTLGCGTGCGSCLGEVQQLLKSHSVCVV